MSERSTPRSFTAAMLVDSAGDGLWAPFSLLFFLYDKHLSLDTAGSALSIGSLVALVGGGLVAGVIADRIGPFRAAAVSSVIRAVAFPCYLLTGNVIAIAVLAGVISFGIRVFWAANGGMVAAITPDPAERTQLFAMLNSFRNVGMGVGALAVTVTAGMGHAHAGLFYTAIVLINAVSFAAAAWCLWRLRSLDDRGDTAGGGGRQQSAAVSYRTVFADRPFVVYTLTAVVLALGSVTFGTIFPVFLLKLAKLPSWAPGAAFLVACAVIPLSQPLVKRLVERIRVLSLMTGAAAVFVGYFLALLAVPNLPQAGRYALLGGLIIVFGFGQAVLAAVMSTVVLEYAPAQARGRYNAFFQLSWGLASAAGPGLFAWIFTSSPTALWVGLAVASALAGVVLWQLQQSARVTTDKQVPNDPVESAVAS
jgi:MFS family permease